MRDEQAAEAQAERERIDLQDQAEFADWIEAQYAASQVATTDAGKLLALLLAPKDAAPETSQ